VSAINTHMKFKDILEEELNQIDEGLIHVLGRALKYIAILAATAFVGRAVMRFIRDKKKDSEETQHYIVVGTVVSLSSGSKRHVFDWIEEAATNFSGLTNATTYQTDVKMINTDEGKAFNTNIVLFYESRRELQQSKKMIARINDRSDDFNFEVIKQGKA